MAVMDKNKRSKNNIKHCDIENSIKRLAWRFNPNDVNEVQRFKPNETDRKALKNIAGWIDRQKQNSINNNQLFAKLFIREFCLIIRKHKADVLEDLPQKELSKLLDLPLNYYYQAFCNDLHNNQIENIVERSGEDNFKENLKELCKREYPFEVVAFKLNEMITEALNRFS